LHISSHITCSVTLLKVAGATGIMTESSISSVKTLVKADDLDQNNNSSLLSETVVLKLNGGLGTGMGLDKAKSLLKVKDDDCFLDLTAKQVIKMRETFQSNIK